MPKKKMASVTAASTYRPFKCRACVPLLAISRTMQKKFESQTKTMKSGASSWRRGIKRKKGRAEGGGEGDEVMRVDDAVLVQGEQYSEPRMG